MKPPETALFLPRWAVGEPWGLTRTICAAVDKSLEIRDDQIRQLARLVVVAERREPSRFSTRKRRRSRCR